MPIGYGTDVICSQMSIAMMSAPADASFTACARPWPRAAPVMNATLPSRVDMTGSVPRANLRDNPKSIGTQRVSIHQARHGSISAKLFHSIGG